MDIDSDRIEYPSALERELAPIDGFTRRKALAEVREEKAQQNHDSELYVFQDELPKLPPLLRPQRERKKQRLFAGFRP